TYPKNAAVRLTAQELAPGAHQGWSGCFIANGASCTVPLTADRTVTVKFDPARTYAPRAYFSNVKKSMLERIADLTWYHRYSKYYDPEDHGAGDPDDFFAASSLRWYNRKRENGTGNCNGDGHLRVKIASARELTVRKLMAGRYRYKCRLVDTSR